MISGPDGLRLCAACFVKAAKATMSDATAAKPATPAKSAARAAVTNCQGEVPELDA